MDLQLTGKVVVITGAAKGIGAATANCFAREGAWVVLVDRDEDALELLSRKIPKSLPIVCDITEADAADHIVQTALDRLRSIDVLINNAGVNDAVPLSASPSEFLASLQRNLLPVFAITHAARECLIKAHGSIVNVSSKVAETGQGSTSGYAAAKGAMNALTREWAVALAPHGVRVNAVVPAECDTDQYQRWFAAQPDPSKVRQTVEQLVPLQGRLTTAAEVADAIVYLASPRNGHITGQWLHVDGGYVHLDRAVTSAHVGWKAQRSEGNPPSSSKR